MQYLSHFKSKIVVDTIGLSYSSPIGARNATFHDDVQSASKIMPLNWRRRRMMHIGLFLLSSFTFCRRESGILWLWNDLKFRNDDRIYILTISCSVKCTAL